MADLLDQVKFKAEEDLESFIRLVHPKRVLGSIHQELIRWMTRPDTGSHLLILLPRDHCKSTIAAYYAAWTITRNPAVRILYVSSTSNLATKQLKFIKDILTSDIYRRYWPNMVNRDEAKRELWNSAEISIDHPIRKEENVRDPTIFTAGLTTNITGLHCDLTIMDDPVVYENAYTQEGRDRTELQYSLLASIEAADAKQICVGTRYHPRDLYGSMITKEVEVFDNDGRIISTKPLYEVFQREVEDQGDGTGQFLWPLQQRSDGKWFGFNAEILAKKRAQYLDRIQFRAQYYNDPNDFETAGISSECFQYYNPDLLTRIDGNWYLGARRLNICASVDFAYTTTKKADYTCIVVVGVDADKNYYVLDIDRFKTGQPADYFQHILKLHNKWQFRKLLAEATAAQSVIINSLKFDYIRPNGIALAIEEENPSRHAGTKEERIHNILQPRYANRQIWHYRGGNCQPLEEELLLQNPPHDDIKDALSVAVDKVIAPSGIGKPTSYMNNIDYTHYRFGGVG